MSFECMTWAVKQDTGSIATKLVLLLLANRVNHDSGLCIPRIKFVAQEASASEETVKRALKDLADKGFIQIIPRFKDGVQLSNSYKMGMEGVGTICAQGGQVEGGGINLSPRGDQFEPRVGSKTPPRITRKDNQEEEPLPPNPPQAGGARTRKPTAAQQEKQELEQLVKDIYQAYPRKVGPAAAMKSIEKACKLIDPKELLQAVRDYEAATSQWPEADRDYIPMPTTWFNQQRWMEDRKEWTRKIPRAQSSEAAKAPAELPKWKTDRIAMAEDAVRLAERELRSLTAQGFTRQTCGLRFGDADDKLLRARQKLAAERGELVPGLAPETGATGLGS